MRDRDRILAQKLKARLKIFNREKRSLPGIHPVSNCEAFVEQLIESIRRIAYFSVIGERDISNLRGDTSSDLFDPIKAAFLQFRQENLEEAFWLIFLSVHFGKHRRSGWRLARDIYGALGSSLSWDWPRTSSDPKGFRQWIISHAETIGGGDGIPRHFGNHRKYETLKESSPRGTGKVVESYVKWVLQYGSHEKLMEEAQRQVGGNPRKSFHYLYRSMENVISFGRTARFDYLTMVGKIGLAPIEPGSPYIEGSTGPLKGAKLLFGEKEAKASELEKWLIELDDHLKLYFGMQVLEDALCNWQKCPEKFKPFRG